MLVVIGGVVAMLAVAGSLFYQSRSESAGGAGDETIQPFAGIFAGPSEVHTVRLAGPEKTATLVRQSEGWGLAEMDGYPVAAAPVTAMIEKLLAAKALKRIPADEANLKKLGIVTAGEETVWHRVSVRGADGQTRLRLAVGREETTPAASDLVASYLHQPDAETVWLVDAPFPKTLPEQTHWVDKEIFALPRGAIVELRTAPASGAPVHVKRAETGGQFTLVDTTVELDSERRQTINDLLLPFTRMTAGDIAAVPEEAAENSDLPGMLRLADGTVLRFGATQRDDGTWIRFAVKAGETPASTDEGSAVDPSVEDLRGRLVGWQFRVPPFNAKRLTATVEDLAPPSETSAENGTDNPDESDDPAPESP